ncbi:hypothetical protein, partial [Arcanobacterium bovis]|uniref:hypothetical protein n=1 Tax=Arcanobacterium bovis TaxID=2529275 RepID=UPI00361476AD
AKIVASIAALSTPIITGVVAVIAVIALIVAMLPSWLASYLFDEDAQANAYAAVLMTDDYPYRNQPNGSPNTVTGLYVGSDTDFVLWRINRDLGSVADKPSETVTKLFPKGALAWQWALAGNLPTWTAVAEAAKVMPGDILVWRQGARSAQSTNGYVSYIGNVTNDGVVTENYFAGHYYTESITTNHL